MSIFLSLARKSAPYLALLAIVAALWLRGSHYAEQAQINEIKLKSAIAIGNANAARAREQTALSRKIDARSAVAALTKREIYAQSERRQKAISDAAMEDDGPLARVLRDQLERLPVAPAADAGCASAAAANSRRSAAADGGGVSPAAGGESTGCGAGA